MTIANSRALGNANARLGKYKILDLILVLFLSPVAIVLVSVIAFSLFVFQGAPVLFVQERIGLHGKLFKLYKFRTMSDGDDHSVSGANLRITRFGKFLRLSSLDELPSLFNVILGDMSLVGPRPLPSYYSEYFLPSEMVRHEALPGLTGLAQVKGRNFLGWRKRFKYDCFYVNHQSVCFDLVILLMTVNVCFRHKLVEIAGTGIQRLDVERQK